MTGTLDELIVKIDSNIKGAMSGISKVEGSMNRLESSVGKSTKRIRKATLLVGGAFAAIGAAAGVATVGLGAIFTKQASNMESYMDTLRVLEGSQEAAAEKMQWLLDFAKKTPFELPGLIEATTKLKAYGIDAEEVLQTLGDTAAVMGKPINQAVEALADAQTGEFERMKEFGIKAIVIAKANAEQLGATAEQVGMTALTFVDKYGKQQSKIIDRNNREQVTSSIQAIWNEKYAGAMETKSRSMEGMVSNIKDTLYQGTMAVMGFNAETGKFDPGSLFDKARVGVKRLLDRINEIDFSALADKIEGVVNKIIATMSNLATELAPTFDNLKSIFASLIGITKDLFGIFNNGSGEVTSLSDAINTITLGLAKFFKWVDAHPSITKLVVTLVIAASVFSHLVPIIAAVIKAFVAIGSVVAFVSAHFAAGGTLAGLLGTAIAAIGGPITLIIAAVALFAAAWATNLFGIRDKTKSAIDFVIGAFKKIPALLSDAKTWGENLITAFIEGIKAKFSSIASAVKAAANIVKDYLGFSSPTKEGPGRDVMKWGPNLVKSFSQGVEDNLSSVNDSFNALVSPKIDSFRGSSFRRVGGNMPESLGQQNIFKISIRDTIIREDTDIDKLVNKLEARIAGKVRGVSV